MEGRTLLASLMILSVLVSGCGQVSNQPAKTPTAEPAKSKGVIGLSVLTLTNPFFKVIADTMTEEAAKSGYQVVVVSGEFDPAKQQNQVKDFLVQRVAAIVLCPCDSK